jgi:hypothetical protein
MSYKSYRPMMKFDERQNDGSHFAGNGLRFESEAEAAAQARELMTRWFVPCGYRVDPSLDKPNYRWDFDKQKTVAI